MTQESVCVGIDVAKEIPEVAINNASKTRQFKNDHKGVARTVPLHRQFEAIQDYFIARPRMEYHDSGLDTVLSTTLSEDAGITAGRYPANDESANYFAFIEFRYTIESIRVVPHQISG